MVWVVPVTSQSKADLTGIRTGLRLLLAPGNVYELRIPKAGRFGTVSGYFDDLEAMADAAESWSGKAPGIYLTPNPVDPRLLARAANRLREHAEETTSDKQITRRDYLLIDIDPIRPAGISSTDAEHLAARKAAAEIGMWLTDALGFPAESIVLGNSGNGAHVDVRIDLPNNEASTKLLQNGLSALDLRFSDGIVHIDQTTYNAARIWKCPGTIARKGDSTTDRPHRAASITAAPTMLRPAPREALERLAALAPNPVSEPQPSTNGHRPAVWGDLDVERYLIEHGLTIVKTGPWDGAGKKWVLGVCPWNAEHTDRSAYVVQFANGAIGAGCQHDSCSGKGWHDLRATLGDHQTSRQNDQLNPAQIHNLKKRDHLDPGGVRLVTVEDVAAVQVLWLWYPRIPLGKVTLIEGDPGLGKSWLTLAIATGVSLGTGLPGADAMPDGSVIICSAEDGIGDTVRPRLESMGADLGRIHAITGPAVLDDDGLELIEGFIADKRPALFIFDPLVAYLGAQLDLHRANEVRHVMAALAALAERNGCAIVAVRHLAKGQTNRAIYRGLGSIDLTAACRSVLLIGADPDDPGQRVLVQIKSNLAAPAPTIGYRLDRGVFTWTGECDVTAAQILGPESDGASVRPRDEARDFLAEVLADGPVPTRDVQQKARLAGIAGMTLSRARTDLSIRAIPEREPGKPGVRSWLWALPEGGLEGQKGVRTSLRLLEKSDVLNPVEDEFESEPAETPPGGEVLNPQREMESRTPQFRRCDVGHETPQPGCLWCKRQGKSPLQLPLSDSPS
jgi:hypothetical protein